MVQELVRHIGSLKADLLSVAAAGGGEWAVGPLTSCYRACNIHRYVTTGAVCNHIGMV